MPQIDTEVPIDGELELKKRSRRRLVGAIALALLAIVVLPMVMDHEPRQPAQEIQVKIPSQDAGGFTSRILPAKPATPLPTATTETKAGQDTASEAPKSEVKTEAKPEPKPEAKLEIKPEPKPEPKPKPEAKSDPKPAESSKPADKAASAKAEEVKALAALNGANVGDQWVVQLGAYKESANVKQLTAKLKQMGLPSFTEEFQSPQGPRTRVRAGPFKTRDAAEKARDRIKKIGVDGSVAQQ